MKLNRISGIPIVERSGKLCGIITNRDVRFAENPRQPVSELMTRDNLATVPVGTSEAEARRILHHRRIEKLLVVDQARSLRGADYRQGHREISRGAARDEGRRGTAACRGCDHSRRRGFRTLGALIDAGCDCVVIDTAHGHNRDVAKAVERVKGLSNSVQVVAGNVATYDGAKALDRSGRGCDQGGHRSGLDLHDSASSRGWGSRS